MAKSATGKKQMQSARNRDCTVRLPGHCNFNPETSVMAHLNGVRFGKGIGIKTNLGAYCCSSCHAVIDGSTPTDLTEEEVKLAHYEGILETILIMLSEGLL